MDVMWAETSYSIRSSILTHARSVKLNVLFSMLYSTFSSSTGEPPSGTIVILTTHSFARSIVRHGSAEPHGNSRDPYRIDVLQPSTVSIVVFLVPSVLFTLTIILYV